MRKTIKILILILLTSGITGSLHSQDYKELKHKISKQQLRVANKDAKVFWKWFKTNINKIENIENNPAIKTELSLRLNEYFKGLSYFLGKTPENYELVISCAGNSEVAPWVVVLTDKAPEIENWKITPFIQPKQKLSSEFTIYDVTIKKEEPRIIVDTTGNGYFGITVFLDDKRIFSEAEYAIVLAYLQEIYGEFNLMYKVSLTNILPKNLIGNKPTISLSELFELNNKKNKPKS
jgi:hypothetical protein